jgi:hypothetical protein
MALNIIPDALESASNAFIDMKVDLDEEKAARVVAQVEVDVLSRVVKDPKISADRFAT